MSDYVEYTAALDTSSSTSVRYVLPNENDSLVTLVYRTDATKAYVYKTTADELERFVKGYQTASSKGRFVNDWTLGRQSDRVVEDPTYRLAPAEGASKRKNQSDTSNLWKGVFLVGDAEITLTKHVPTGEDPQATLLAEAKQVVTKGTPQYKELSRSFV